MFLLFLVALLLLRISRTACVDGYFCDVIVEQVSCNTTNETDRLEMLSACPETCGACDVTLAPTRTPSSPPTKMEQLRETIILGLAGCLIVVIVCAGLYAQVFNHRETKCKDSNVLKGTTSNVLKRTTKDMYQTKDWSADQPTM